MSGLKNVWTVFLSTCVLVGCSEAPFSSARVLPTEAGLAKGPTARAALADGIVAASIAVKQYSTDGSFWIQNTESTYDAAVNFDQTVGGMIEDCSSGDYGAEGTTLDLLRAHLVDTIQARSGFTAMVTGSTGSIVLRWAEADGSDYFVRLGVTVNAPSADPTVTSSGNVYTYTGGTIYVLRTSGVKGSKTNPRTKRDVVCPNLDQVQLTYPL
ncbi:MAG TPA: hypothetical protein VF981_16395 [Gemmatimonadaceae bacterium]